MSCSDLNVFISGPGPPWVFWNHKPSLKLSSTWNWHPESVIQTAEETAAKLVIQEILAHIVDPTYHYFSYLRCIWWIWIVRWGLLVVTRKTSSGGIDVDEPMNWKRRHFVKVNHVHYVLGSRLQDEHPEFIHAFNAYTPPGDVTGDLVFVPSSWKASLNIHKVTSSTPWNVSYYQVCQLREGRGYPEVGGAWDQPRRQDCNFKVKPKNEKSCRSSTSWNTVSPSVHPPEKSKPPEQP